MQRFRLNGHPWWISFVFFFVGFSPGMWMPSLPNVLREMEYERWIPWIYFGAPLGGILSPFLLGSLSDGKFSANRLLGVVLCIGSITMTSAFSALYYLGWIELFVGLMLVNALLSAPIWSLVSQTALFHLHGREEQFANYRLWGTIGWMLAGVTGGYLLNADSSAFSGVIAGILRIPAGIACFLMPLCPPAGRSKERFNLLAMIGEGSRDLWKQRNTRVLLLSAGGVALPMAAFYMYGPLTLKDLGVVSPTAMMSWAQLVELVGMLTLAWVAKRMRLKWMISIGLAAVVVRQFCFAFAAERSQLFPVYIALATHGITFSYFYTMAQVYMEKRVAPALRGRAQGMLSVIFTGLGSGVGTLLMGRLYEGISPTRLDQWTHFWVILGIMALVPTLYFLARYKRHVE